mmetsp:Transcript_20623/g.30956  ORF Transcript_20623/g.30956 Transcript_20623/m.30956 type:complete len:114 (-) Transcript_20623:232-573(-)
MQTFAKLDDLKKILQDIGFQDVDIDLSDSSMEVDVPLTDDNDNNNIDEDEDEDTQNFSTDSGGKDNKSSNDADDDDGSRYKVHHDEGRKRFRHLENFDMNELCARVVIKGRKP